jgi:hypothetical protein
VISRLITMAFLVALEGLASQALWRLAMKASIASIVIGDGINCIHRDWPIAIGDW